jgi:hypothetical protein
LLLVGLLRGLLWRRFGVLLLRRLQPKHCHQLLFTRCAFGEEFALVGQLAGELCNGGGVAAALLTACAGGGSNVLPQRQLLLLLLLGLCGLCWLLRLARVRSNWCRVQQLLCRLLPLPWCRLRGQGRLLSGGGGGLARRGVSCNRARLKVLAGTWHHTQTVK